VNQQERIVVEPNILLSKPIISGTRIAVEFIIGLLAQGWSNEDIIENNCITIEDIRACLSYANEVLKAEKVYPIPA
jgi:uncharacterized protein (DUF433 family)